MTALAAGPPAETLCQNPCSARGLADFTNPPPRGLSPITLQSRVPISRSSHPDAPLTHKPTLAISMGDPAGVGPEVLVAALAEPARRAAARYLILGDAAILNDAADLLRVHPFWWRARYDPDHPPAGSDVHDALILESPQGPSASDDLAALPRCQPTALSGSSSFQWVEHAIACAKLPETHPLHAHAIVTAPINKHAWSLAGKDRWPGHTELLAARLSSRASRMMFVSPKLKVILATAHLPLMGVAGALTIGCIFETIELGHRAMIDLGITNPRIAVCGLNPHAGEQGRFGDEEARLIEPAISLAQQQSINATGPYPGDTIFNAAVAGRFDLVVAMYHDQGLIPVKLLGFDEAVNCTVGLSTVRTSPDHGTAYDIAWQGKANPGSMAAAIDLAITMAKHRMAEPHARHSKS